MDDRLRKVVDVRGSIITLAGGATIQAYADDVVIGTDVWLSPDLKVGQPDKEMALFEVGDHSRIFGGIIAPAYFSCGDYVTIHEGVFCYGRSRATIGHNSWFGMRCTLDAEGAFHVGNGFGAGQDTHLWSHIRHGDVSMGSRFLEFSEFKASNDVWFVGRCTGSPTGAQSHGAFSVALTESNVTKPMQSNHVYGGNPAKDLTYKIGEPYVIPSAEQREQYFAKKLMEFSKNIDMPAREVLAMADQFDPVTRKYGKTNSDLEVSFMRFLLPEMKFTPYSVGSPR